MPTRRPAWLPSRWEASPGWNRPGSPRWEHRVILNRILANLAERYRALRISTNLAWVEACQEVSFRSRRRTRRTLALSPLGGHRPQIEVLLGDPTLGMRAQDQEDLVPADVDVGVMVGLLGSQADPGDETHGFVEVLELELRLDRLPVPLPNRVLFQEGLDCLFRRLAPCVLLSVRLASSVWRLASLTSNLAASMSALSLLQLRRPFLG